VDLLRIVLAVLATVVAFAMLWIGFAVATKVLGATDLKNWMPLAFLVGLGSPVVGGYISASLITPGSKTHASAAGAIAGMIFAAYSGFSMAGLIATALLSVGLATLGALWARSSASRTPKARQDI
jgi:hypothetical protein